MKVRFFGFTVNASCKQLSLNNWASHVCTNKPDMQSVEQGQRLLLLNSQENPQYHLGLVVTVKDQRRFCQIVSSEGHVRLRVNEIAQDTGLMEFNFFVINKITGAGMYQHYHQSCSVASFGGLLTSSYSDFRKMKVKSAVEALSEADRTERKISSIKRNFAGRLNWTQLVRQEALAALIAELSSVKAFEYELSTPEVHEDEFRPLSSHINARSSRIRFAVGTPVGLVASAISGFSKAGNAKKGRVEGVDSDGNPQYLSILDNPDNFGEHEFDDVADQLNDLDLDAFHNSWVIQELLRSCDAHRHIIEVPIKP